VKWLILKSSVIRGELIAHASISTYNINRKSWKSVGSFEIYINIKIKYPMKQKQWDDNNMPSGGYKITKKIKLK